MNPDISCQVSGIKWVCAGKPAGVSAASPPDPGSAHGAGAGRGTRGLGAHRVPRRGGPLVGGGAGVRRGRPRRRVPAHRRVPHPLDRAVGQGSRGAAPRRHARTRGRAGAGHGVRRCPGQAAGGHAQGGRRPGLRGAPALPPRQRRLVQVLPRAGPPRPGGHCRVGGTTGRGRLPPLRLGRGGQARPRPARSRAQGGGLVPGGGA